MGATGHIKLVKRKRGDQWYVKYRLPDGRQIQKRLGPAWTGKGRPPTGHFSRKMAEAELEAILTDVRRGTRHPAATGATFADAAAEFLRYVEQVDKRDPTTVKDYRGVIDGYLIDAFGDMALENVTPDVIDAYKEALIVEGRLSNRTVVRHLVVLHGIFKRARRVWKLRDNPASADLVKRPQVTYTGEFDTYDRDEIQALVSAAHDPQDAAIYVTAAYTGLRQGELLALRWRDVDLVGGLVHVRANYTDRTEKVPKGRRVRSVPMVPEVVDVLARLKDRGHFAGEDDLVFCSPAGEHMDNLRCAAGSMRRATGRACAGCASTTCVITSPRWRSACWTRTRCSRTWATSTTPRPSVTCIIAPVRSTRSCLTRRRGDTAGTYSLTPMRGRCPKAPLIAGLRERPRQDSNLGPTA
jgi:integrase